jgi:hypothetical protein
MGERMRRWVEELWRGVKMMVRLVHLVYLVHLHTRRALPRGVGGAGTRGRSL